MYSFLTPRAVAGAALALVLVAAVGLWSGEMRWSPLGLLGGELLAIYAAILWTTPTIPPFSTRAAEWPASDHPADNQSDDVTPGSTSPASEGL